MEEERFIDPVPDSINQVTGVVRYLRDAPPAHYSLKIYSFSKFVNLLDEKFESASFSASGHTWKLVLYPNGNAETGGGGHISLYLAIDKTDSLPLGWEAHVIIKMFVYNHHKDKYLTIQDDVRHQIRRFHRAKKENGFHRLISLDILNDATNGYLSDDSCVFGVEVFIVKHSDDGNGEVLKIINNPVQHTFNWKITTFSSISEETLYSEQYDAGDHKWRLLVYPKGYSRARDNLSLFLKLDETSPLTCNRVLAAYSLVIKNQISNNHCESTGSAKWFKADDKTNAWGCRKFMLLSKLKDKSSGFMVDDSILVEAKVTIKAQVSTFS